MPTPNHENLLEHVKHLFHKKEFQMIIELLSDEVLEMESSAELYAWKSRTFSGLNNFEKALFYAEMANYIKPDLALA